MPDLLLFLATSVAITLAPGPDNLQVLARGMAQGRRAGVVAALGFASGCLFHTVVAAVGLAAVLRSSPVAFQCIKFAGAAYLVWIGIQALRSRGALGKGADAPAVPLAKVFRQSVLANLMNPKVTLFFLVFLPQFVRADAANAGWQMLLLGVVFMLQTAVVFSLFGLFAGVLGDWLKHRPGAGRWLDRVAGAIFLALGIKVALPA
ncbi:LysE family translocator [Cupriavidus basilensis]|uniref:LysE family translocator n=1 Tax=Cupriavidus basilensis TaxID=68895 RepID=A0ABT6AQ26_9BURK|nr:LysE family translocator [Cupriavidus basilensis]MDF3834724.1 LysE family translocator [Cupriavidus basilensis]